MFTHHEKKEKFYENELNTNNMIHIRQNNTKKIFNFEEKGIAYIIEEHYNYE